MKNSTNETYVLRATGLSKQFGGHSVLRQIDLKVTAGESIAVMGDNGSGKTTLLRFYKKFLEKRDRKSVV